MTKHHKDVRLSSVLADGSPYLVVYSSEINRWIRVFRDSMDEAIGARK